MRVKEELFKDVETIQNYNDDPTSVSDLSLEEQKEYCDLIEQLENDFQKMMEEIS